MDAVPALEQRLTDARATAPGTPTELAALVELASQLVRDAHRRGALALEGVELAARLGDTVARLRCQAMVAEFVARHRSAIEALPQALTILAEAEQGTDELSRAQANHSAAHCYEQLGCVSEALDHVRRGIDGYRAGGDRLGEARLFSFMADLYQQLGEQARSRDLYERAYRMVLDLGDLSGAGVMLSSLADLQRTAGAPEQAIATCERSLEHFEQAGMPLDSHMAMLSYAQALAALGRYDLAGLWTKRAAERNRLPDGTVANPYYELRVLRVLARSTQLPTGDLAGARATLETAIALADAQGAVPAAADAEALLAEVLHTEGDHGSAYAHLMRSYRLNDEVSRSVQDQRVRALRVRFEVELAERDARRYREQAEAQAEVIAELERTRVELATRMSELERLNTEIVQLSQTDPLTGIANRRFINDRLTELCRVSARYGSPVSVAVFDVDLFKHVNDRYGHGTGDSVLVVLADLVRQYMRATDVPGRLGGDEFVIVLPRTDADEAVAACERLHAAVRAYPWQELAEGLAVTITIGVAGGTTEGDPEQLLRRADDALYLGKHAGRDTVTR